MCELIHEQMNNMNRPGFAGELNLSSTGTQRHGDSPPHLTEEHADELKQELAKVEDEIQTLRQVLLAKEKYALEIRGHLGMGPLSGLKENLAKGWHEVQTSTAYLSASATLDDISQSNAYKRTKETLNEAAQVTTAALSTAGIELTRRLGQLRALPLPSPPRPTLNHIHSISVPTMRSSFVPSGQAMQVMQIVPSFKVF